MELHNGYIAHGEADILMVTPHLSYAIEVKTTDSSKAFVKAMHQLWKDDRYIHANWYTDKIVNFYVCKSNNDKGYRIKKKEPK